MQFTNLSKITHTMSSDRRGNVEEAIKWAKKKIKDHVEKDFDDKHTWTIYFLVDIKIIYIISYAYISIVNLVSSTANIEATDDKNTQVDFRVSSVHMGPVTNISDAVLWNCRADSDSSYYYIFLYWMLIVGLISALSGYVLTKLIALVNTAFVSPDRGLKRLWHIAEFQTRFKLNGTDILEHSIENLQPPSDDTINEFKCFWGNCCRNFVLFFILLPLQVAIMTLSYLSYDLHPLACIRGQDDTSIQYFREGKNMGRVEIDLSHELLRFQLIAGILVIGFVLFILLIASCFYYCSYKIVEKMKERIKNPN